MRIPERRLLLVVGMGSAAGLVTRPLLAVASLCVPPFCLSSVAFFFPQTGGKHAVSKAHLLELSTLRLPGLQFLGEEHVRPRPQRRPVKGGQRPGCDLQSLRDHPQVGWKLGCSR